MRRLLTEELIGFYNDDARAWPAQAESSTRVEAWVGKSAGEGSVLAVADGRRERAVVAIDPNCADVAGIEAIWSSSGRFQSADPALN